MIGVSITSGPDGGNSESCCQIDERLRYLRTRRKQFTRPVIGATDRGRYFLEIGDTRRDLLTMLEKEHPAAPFVAMSKPYHPAAVTNERAWAAHQISMGKAGGCDDHACHFRNSAGIDDLSVDIRGTAFQIRVWKLPPVHSLR
jgi:hypothetical protein